jgi:hypothetical protein
MYCCALIDVLHVDMEFTFICKHHCALLRSFLPFSSFNVYNSYITVYITDLHLIPQTPVDCTIESAERRHSSSVAVGKLSF